MLSTACLDTIECLNSSDIMGNLGNRVNLSHFEKSNLKKEEIVKELDSYENRDMRLQAVNDFTMAIHTEAPDLFQNHWNSVGEKVNELLMPSINLAAKNYTKHFQSELPPNVESELLLMAMHSHFSECAPLPEFFATLLPLYKIGNFAVAWNDNIVQYY